MELSLDSAQTLALKAALAQVLSRCCSPLPKGPGCAQQCSSPDTSPGQEGPQGLPGEVGQ